MTRVAHFRRVAPPFCSCPECAALDAAHPGEGRQLMLLQVPRGRPDGAPASLPDASAVPPAGVSAPKGRPVETRRQMPRGARGRKPENTHASI